ncbi:MAG TPA: cation transporter [Aquabacterium sp.]|uniref:heavy-metal-associated domain-containing protein n=1 Tax=Aquabacterium sp. TaxID=1872578 RepID=UPI002E3184DE|nr:cation transporter [Aquabacterium sp.]HEX5373181.1 cation transporter [Aquabacterium sp.]
MSDAITYRMNVQGMSCQHCVKAVTQAVQAQDPSAQVSVDLPQGRVEVTTSLPEESVKAIITDEGYTVQP